MGERRHMCFICTNGGCKYPLPMQMKLNVRTACPLLVPNHPLSTTPPVHKAKKVLRTLLYYVAVIYTVWRLCRRGVSNSKLAGWIRSTRCLNLACGAGLEIAKNKPTVPLGDKTGHKGATRHTHPPTSFLAWMSSSILPAKTGHRGLCTTSHCPFWPAGCCILSLPPASSWRRTTMLI